MQRDMAGGVEERNSEKGLGWRRKVKGSAC